MNVARGKGIGTSLPAVLRSLVEGVVDSVADQITNDLDGSEFPDILSFEERTENLTRDLVRSMVAQFVRVRSRQATETSMKCPGCGKSMERQRRSSWSRQTLWGETRVEDDDYLCCRDCKTSSRPQFMIQTSLLAS